MARPQKKGMDYFPHDVDALNDEKIEALRSLYGNNGYAFYFIMLERIYRSNNFELDVSDAETREETFQILSRKMLLTIDEFHKILNTAFKWGCFDKIEYEERGVITSNGVKKRSLVVTKKRTAMKERYNKSISDAETGEETTQRKEKERKEEKRKEEESTVKQIIEEVDIDDFEF